MPNFSYPWANNVIYERQYKFNLAKKVDIMKKLENEMEKEKEIVVKAVSHGTEFKVVSVKNSLKIRVGSLLIKQELEYLMKEGWDITITK